RWLGRDVALARPSLAVGGLFSCAREVRSVVRIAGAFVFGGLRIRAHRSREFDGTRRIETFVFCGDEGSGRSSLFDPEFESGLDVVLRIFRAGGTERAKIRARTASAVLYAGKHVKAYKGLRFVDAKFRPDRLPIINAVERGNRGVISP